MSGVTTVKNGTLFTQLAKWLIVLSIVIALSVFITFELAIACNNGLAFALGYVFLVLASGGVGGFVYSMTSGEFHRVRLPKFITNTEIADRKILDTGFLGHVIIGMLSGEILVSIAMTQAGADSLKPLFNAPINTAENTASLLRLCFYTISVGSIGGFLGLRLIMRISNRTLAAIEEKFERLDKKIDDRHREVESSTLFDSIKLARAVMSEGHIDEALDIINRNLERKKTKEGEFTKAFILKRTGDIHGALASLDRALSSESLGFIKSDANIYYNMACYHALLTPSNLAPVKENLQKSIAMKPSNAADIEQDTDFQEVLKNPEFAAFVQTLKNPPK